jgi:hypothetical protein
MDFFLYVQEEEPSAVSTAVDVLPHTEAGGKKADRLQRDVDHKLLVSSKSTGRGPAPQRHIPTHAKRKAEKASASQQLPLEMEKAGGKRAWSASPSSARQLRSTHRRQGTMSLCFSIFLRNFLEIS